jgi:CheY-like chemotaxis protein
MEFAQSAPAALQRITGAGEVSLILILSDINMPGMSGLELLPKAKALRPDVPIIMITAYGDAATKRKALDGGAEALLSKPIDFATLRNSANVPKANVRSISAGTKSDAKATPPRACPRGPQHRSRDVVAACYPVASSC